MSAVITVAPVAPMLAQPSLRTEQVTQMLLGDTASVLEEKSEWVRVRAALDGYEGWVHCGYLRAADDAAAADWTNRATGWSDGARVEVGTQRIPLPLGARVALDTGHVVLPDGRTGRVTAGSVRDHAEVRAEAVGYSPERWALAWYEGTPYQWGGRTPWGVDCSGLVQTTYAVRGVLLPRDASQQALAGNAVPHDAIQPGDLLFFHSEGGKTVTHVAFAGEGHTLIHSTVSCGGVLIEPCGPGSRAQQLMRRLVAVRRIPQDH
ncbi:MAG TPA: C40 family peptidase [Gemmatimonadales bacterium]|nr:C40 family peptidase [Gemmatimonadales bacterium]